MPEHGVAPEIKALVFDTFGTVVDWRGSILRYLHRLGTARGIEADWNAFTDGWYAGYHPSMDRVRKGERAWASLDQLHRERLDELLAAHSIFGLSETEKRDLNRVWYRLDPWPDSVEGLLRLKPRYVLSTFSNGSFACLVGMAKHAELPWDCIFSVDLVRHYKPDPDTYRGIVALLDLAPEEVMLVAAHNYDLHHARRHGMGTAYVRRPAEHGPNQTSDLVPSEEWDIVVDSFGALADRLGM